MGINDWWVGDPSQIYWLEVTDRDDLGDDLRAPQTAAGGASTPGYELVRHVNNGDIVLHWWKPPGEEPSMVGYSRASGSLYEDTIRWQAHGSYGRSRAPSVRPSWAFPLVNYTDLATPVTLERIRVLEAELRRVRSELQSRVGSPLYFPFSFSEKRPVRTAQGYMLKMPRQVVETIPELAETLENRQSDAQDLTSPRTPGRRTTDAEMNKALEEHSVAMAIEHLASAGATEIEDVGSTESFDIRARQDDQELRVEVKGRVGRAQAVELTANEVANAQTFTHTWLIVVDEIACSRAASGAPMTSGGRLRVWTEWAPEEEHLIPTNWRYVLPASDTMRR